MLAVYDTDNVRRAGRAKAIEVIVRVLESAAIVPMMEDTSKGEVVQYGGLYC